MYMFCGVVIVGMVCATAHAQEFQIFAAFGGCMICKRFWPSPLISGALHQDLVPPPAGLALLHRFGGVWTDATVPLEPEQLFQIRVLQNLVEA